jgi:hypothetical protein
MDSSAISGPDNMVVWATGRFPRSFSPSGHLSSKWGIDIHMCGVVYWYCTACPVCMLRVYIMYGKT